MLVTGMPLARWIRLPVVPVAYSWCWAKMVLWLSTHSQQGLFAVIVRHQRNVFARGDSAGGQFHLGVLR